MLIVNFTFIISTGRGGKLSDSSFYTDSEKSWNSAAARDLQSITSSSVEGRRPPTRRQEPRAKQSHSLPNHRTVSNNPIL